jgi:hypothetical protein
VSALRTSVHTPLCVLNIFTAISCRLGKVKALASKIDSQLYKDITVFVDPIDGTREFATGSK